MSDNKDLSNVDDANELGYLVKRGICRIWRDDDLGWTGSCMV